MLISFASVEEEFLFLGLHSVLAGCSRRNPKIRDQSGQPVGEKYEFFSFFGKGLLPHSLKSKKWMKKFKSYLLLFLKVKPVGH